ncbi:hypothetical protein GC170_17160 [bacterium]|nr:hypothetical protein [bacterium]
MAVRSQDRCDRPSRSESWRFVISGWGLHQKNSARACARQRSDEVRCRKRPWFRVPGRARRTRQVGTSVTINKGLRWE